MTCPDCNGDGLVFANKALYACHCEAGAKEREVKYMPSDKKHEHPIRMKTWNAPVPVAPLTGRDRAAGNDD